MIVLPQMVEVPLNSRTIKYYENLKYEIPRVKNKWYQYQVPKGTKIMVYVLDLPEKSNVKIEVICDYCFNSVWKQYCDYNKGRNTGNKMDCCDNCRGRKGGDGKVKYTFEIVNEEFSKRGFQLLEEEYLGNNKHHKYICKNGHETSISFSKLLAGQGCRDCSFVTIADKNRLEQDHVNDIFKKEGCVLISEYKHCEEKLDYICSCGGKGHTNLVSFQNGTRCGKCIRSSGEDRIYDYLTNENIIFDPQFKFEDCRNKRKLSFDFAIFNKNGQLESLIEFDGKQHYEAIKFFGGIERFLMLKINDNIKDTYCKENNISLIRIPYWDFENIEEIINEKILKNIIDNNSEDAKFVSSFLL